MHPGEKSNHKERVLGNSHEKADSQHNTISRRAQILDNNNNTHRNDWRTRLMCHHHVNEGEQKEAKKIYRHHAPKILEVSTFF